jgi:hypothetical protein
MSRYLVRAVNAFLCQTIAEFKLSEEHKEVRLFSISELSQIPIPEVYVRAVTRAKSSIVGLPQIFREQIVKKRKV